MKTTKLPKDKLIYEEREALSQQVRNWTGSDLVLSNIKHRLETLKNLIDQSKTADKLKSSEKK